MADAGFSRRQQFAGAVLTSAPQPLGAAIAYVAVETVEDLLPFSFGFAAGPCWGSSSPTCFPGP